MSSTTTSVTAERPVEASSVTAAPTHGPGKVVQITYLALLALAIAAPFIGLYPVFVMKLLSSYIDRFPLMHVTLESANSDTVYQKLLNYEVDVGVLGSDYNDPRLDLVCLGKHEVVIAIPVGHPWTHRKQLNVEELDGQRLIMREKGSMTRRALEEVLAINNIRPNVVMELSRDSVLEATAAGLGLGIISDFEFSRDDRLRALSIAEYQPYTRSYVACLKERSFIPSIDSFVRMSRDYASAENERLRADTVGA